MKKLEYFILLTFQTMMNKSNEDPRYIQLEDYLLQVIKGGPELDLYIKTEMILEGRSLTTCSFDKIDDNFYKVIWSDVFLVLIGDKLAKDSSIKLSKEIELISLADSPLTNYLKTL